jgi:hypothetical protein
MSNGFDQKAKIRILGSFDEKRVVAIERALNLDSPALSFREGLAQIVFFAIEEGRADPGRPKNVRAKLERIEKAAASLIRELAISPEPDPDTDRAVICLTGKDRSVATLINLQSRLIDLETAAKRAKAKIRDKGGKPAAVWRQVLIEKVSSWAESVSRARPTATKDNYGAAKFRGSLVDLVSLADESASMALVERPMTNSAIGKRIDRMRRTKPYR